MLSTSRILSYLSQYFVEVMMYFVTDRLEEILLMLAKRLVLACLVQKPVRMLSL